MGWLIPALIGIGTAIACNKDDKEAPPPCDPRGEPWCSQIYAPTESIPPQVYLNGDPIPVTIFEHPTFWKSYEQICLEISTSYCGFDPNDPNACLEEESIYRIESHLGTDTLSADCNPSEYDTTHLLDPDPATGYHWALSEEAFSTIQSEIAKQRGLSHDEITLSEYNLLQQDPRKIWLPYFYASDGVGVTEANEDGSMKDIWVERYATPNASPWFSIHSRLNNEKNVLMLSLSYFSDKIVFPDGTQSGTQINGREILLDPDPAHPSFLDSIALPTEAIYTDTDTTVEGVLFSSPELAPYLWPSNDLGIVTNHRYWNTHHVSINYYYLTEANELGLYPQPGPATLIGYDLQSGKSTETRLPLHTPKLSAIAASDRMAIFGIKDLFLDQTAEGEEILMGTPSLLVLDATTGSIITEQTGFITPLNNYNGLTYYYSAQFSEDGTYFYWNDVEYRFDAAQDTYVPTAKETIEVSVDPFSYHYPNAPELGSWETEAINYIDINDPRYEAFTGLHHEVLLVDTRLQQGIFFYLPIEDDCYEFSYLSLSGYVINDQSCAVERGPMSIYSDGSQDILHIGYGKTVHRLPVSSLFSQ